MAVRMAIMVARDIHREAADAGSKAEQARIAKWAIASQSEIRIEAMLKLARAYLRVEPDELDSDIWLFNCENGTIDLRTGKRREHRREDYITKLCPIEFDPDAQAPRFERFMSEIFADRDPLVRFTQRYAGSALSGETKDRAFVILHGAGKNGKTTLLEVLRHVLGDYAKDTPIETFMQKTYEGVGNDVAMLRGARFVTASESDKGRKLAVAKVKSLIVAQTVTARFLFQEPFSFKPELKLFIATNHKPVIEETTEAIWDRVNLLPFDVRFEGKDADADLQEKLIAEAPGILAWLVRGCLEWRRSGLNPPPEVRAATAEYRTEMDPVGRFIDEECEAIPGISVKYSTLWDHWEDWAIEVGEEIGSKRAFSARLQEQGFEKIKMRDGIYYADLRIKDPVNDPPGGDGSTETHNASEGEENRSQDRDDPSNRSQAKNGGFAGETSEDPDGCERCEPENENFPLDEPRIEKPWENHSQSFTVHTSRITFPPARGDVLWILRSDDCPRGALRDYVRAEDHDSLRRLTRQVLRVLGMPVEEAWKVEATVATAVEDFDPEAKVRRLVREGMKESIARDQVYRNGGESR
jgi:P4 family phage/plasmid primase-like protien